MKQLDKESALEAAIAYLREGMSDDNTEMCLVIANTETGSLRILGLNMAEEEVPLLLCAAAEEMSEQVVATYSNRTLN